MKLIIQFYNGLFIKPSHKFSINLFFLKNMFSFSLKHMQYIHIFTSLKKIWKVKIFKFNYSFYFTSILIFLSINLLIQLILVLL